MGIPVVASPVGDVADLILEGKTGKLIGQDSPRGIADAIESVFSNPSLRDNARREGPQLVAERYSIDTALHQLIAVYDTLGNKT